MIKKLLISLRQKPKHVRNNVAFGAAGIFTFAVFSIWAYNLPSALESRNGGNTASLFSSVVDEVKDGASSIADTASNNPFQDLIPQEKSERGTLEDTIMSIVKASSTEFVAPAINDEARVVRIATTTSSTSLSTE